MKSTIVIPHENDKGHALKFCTAIRYYGLLGYAKAGSDQIGIQVEYELERLEPLINGDLGIAGTKSAEILYDDPVFWSLELRKSWAPSVSYPT